MTIKVIHGDSRDVLKTLQDASVDSVVCDPPYALVSIQKRFGKPGSAAAQEGRDGLYKRASAGFMGQQWDTGEVAFDPSFWAEVLRVLKPGGHLLAFGGTRSYHRLACAIEDAGFEIRDCLMWVYGSGFPKSHDVSKGIDKAAGAERPVVAEGRAVKRMIPGADQNKDGWIKDNGREFIPTVTQPATNAARQWEGWGTSLKPAVEPIVLARKPLIGTVVENVLTHGTGALNIDGCRVSFENDAPNPATNPLYRREAGYKLHTGNDENSTSWRLKKDRREQPAHSKGRWPANIIHDGSDEVLAAFPEAPGGLAAVRPDSGSGQKTNAVYGAFATNSDHKPRGDSGSAARFFKSCGYSREDMEWMIDRASCAGEPLSLQSAAAASALSLALERSMPGLALNFTAYRAPSTNATPSELRLISEIAIETILTIERRCSRGQPLERLSLSLSHAECVADPAATGTIEITISRWRSNGSAGPVIFTITPRNAGLGGLGSGEASRFHYSAKADKEDRLGSKHPTVKPVDLMAYLCRLVTPPGGTVLDPFAGSGTTGMACMREGFNAILIEREAQFVADIKRRIAHVSGLDAPLFGGHDTPPPRSPGDESTGSSRTKNRPDRIEEVTA